MNNLKLYYPAYPYKETQPWGIYNTFYLQFGFSRHNGSDFAIGNDHKVRMPFDGQVIKIGNQPNGGGIFAGVISEEYEFEDGKYRVLFDCLHMESITAKVGDKLATGEEIGVADNTGKATTGSHTHGQWRRVIWDGIVVNTVDSKFLDLKFLKSVDRNEANNSFDPVPYWTGKYAINMLISSKQLQVIKLLKEWISQLWKKLNEQHPIILK